MALYTPKRLIAGSAIAASTTTYYTAPTATVAVMKELVLCNTDTAARTVDVHIVPVGGSAAAANQILQDLTLQAGETRIFALSTVIPTGSFVQASASSASVVSISASGYEVT